MTPVYWFVCNFRLHIYNDNDLHLGFLILLTHVVDCQKWPLTFISPCVETVCPLSWYGPSILGLGLAMRFTWVTGMSADVTQVASWKAFAFLYLLTFDLCRVREKDTPVLAYRLMSWAIPDWPTASQPQMCERDQPQTANVCTNLQLGFSGGTPD